MSVMGQPANDVEDGESATQQQTTATDAKQSTEPPQKLVSSNSNIVELNDKNFEHLTQASTGQTTGSWLIYFYTDHDTTQFSGTLPDNLQEDYHTTVGIMNVLTKDETKKSAQTYRRLQMQRLPGFVYIHRGKLYDIAKPRTNIYSWEDILQYIQNPKRQDARNVPAIPSLWSRVVKEIRKDKKHATLIFITIFSIMSIAFGGIYWLTNKLIPPPPMDTSSKKRR